MNWLRRKMKEQTIKLQNKSKIVRYQVKADSIRFLCPCFITDHAVISLFTDFLWELSKEKNVFVDTYRMFDTVVADPAEILAQAADSHKKGCRVYLHLKAAKMRPDFFEMVEATLYYFDASATWTDFLANAMAIKKPHRKENLLSAYFAIADHGSMCWFEGDVSYQEQVSKLLEGMARCGYTVEQVRGLSAGALKEKGIFLND